MTNPISPPLKIYSLVPFDRGAKARWLLAELGVEHETHWLDRDGKENESPAFLKLNPMGRVPVMTIGEKSIFESGAICAYLGDVYADRGAAPAIGAPGREEYQQWMYFASATLDVFQTRIMIIEDIPAGEVHATKLKALQTDLHEAYVALDRTLSKNSYLVGNRFSVADICVSYHLFWLRLWPELESVSRDFPKVNAFIDRMKAMPSATKVGAFSYPG